MRYPSHSLTSSPAYPSHHGGETEFHLLYYHYSKQRVAAVEAHLVAMRGPGWTPWAICTNVLNGGDGVGPEQSPDSNYGGPYFNYMLSSAIKTYVFE